MVVEIPLTRGFNALIDDEDLELISLLKWFATNLGHRRTRYAGTNIKIDGKYHSQKMHRLILGVNDSKVIVDHINGNGLDNRRCNLRLANSSENNANVAIFRGNTSGYKGVSYRKDRDTWKTEIRKNTKNVYGKTSKCVHLAALKYNDNVVKYHGEFSWLNNVKECICDECGTYKKTRDSG